MSRLVRRGLPVLVTTVAATAALAAPAGAATLSGPPSVERSTFPIAGSTVSCDDGVVFTATGGFVRETAIFSQPPGGGVAATFVDVVKNGRATAGGQSYRVVGTDNGRFAGPSEELAQGQISWHLLILGSHGIVGSVIGTEYDTPTSSDFVNQGGTCRPPTEPGVS